MDSLYTNARYFVMDDGHRCIAQIMALAEPDGFRIYVAWEWKHMAKKGVYGFAKSRQVYERVTWEAIIETADRGWDIGCTGEERKIFSNLFDGIPAK